jgi:hypothetical protein
MLITLVQDQFETGPPLTVFVPEDRADDLIGVMAMEGWHVLSKIYEPVAPVNDFLQVALLEVSTLPAGAPIRVAVEYGALAAIANAPDCRLAKAASPPARPARQEHHRSVPVRKLSRKAR